MRILVAEDEAVIRLDLVEILRDLGHEVVAEVADGRSAVEGAREHRPDVAVMDVKMPRLDGITAAEEMARDQLCPVVLLTAFTDPELVDRAAEAGVLAYVTKPFGPADLAPALAVARARYEQMRALAEEVEDLTERMEARKEIDRAKGLLQSRLGLDEAEAFRWLQKTAMDRRTSMRELAVAVVEQMGPTGG
ncbi:ANTAR domain-containing response regulator [Kytococcus aerolatus]|nr:response regulator [Kytococcus aerolatus]